MRFLLLLAAMATTGCSSVGTQGPPPGAVEEIEAGQSLFPSDAAILSDQEIARILSARVEIPESMRVALLYLEHRSMPLSSRPWYYRRDEPQQELRLAMQSVHRLLEDNRVYDVSYLPTFLLPKQKSVGLIREAAARYQADWVLIFKSETRPHEKDRTFGTDEARAYCLAECAVLDVRTGTIPFTSRASQDVTIAKTDEDWSLSEAVDRAELEAIDAAMSENVENLLQYLERASD